MGKKAMKTSLLLVLLMLSPSLVQAAELFGVDLASTERDELRSAVKNAGLKLISEAGDDAFFDSYESDLVLSKSTRLYLGFVKQDRKFAFAEYEFIGLKQPVLVKKLNQKYGKAMLKSGKFLTDQAYKWQSGGVEIELYTDWSNYRTRLLYSIPEQLVRLNQEKTEFATQMGEVPLVFNEVAY